MPVFYGIFFYSVVMVVGPFTEIIKISGVVYPKQCDIHLWEYQI